VEKEKAMNWKRGMARFIVALLIVTGLSACSGFIVSFFFMDKFVESWLQPSYYSQQVQIAAIALLVLLTALPAISVAFWLLKWADRSFEEET